MRETKFIEQNKKKWAELEETLEKSQHDPDKIKRLFVQITDDLSYSRTFYPNRSVRVYLNDLAQRLFFRIYQKRRSPLGSLLTFWTEELPDLVYEARRDFLISFLVFALAFGIGVLSSVMDPEFANLILGDSYINMTEENIASGDPLAVYKERGKFSMSLGITANNLFVAFLTFVSGILFGVGTLVIMIRNGVMVGTFQYFFIERDLFWESFLTIWVHGTLEISAIVIAGAAGLTLGRGLAFPGTYTRSKAFQLSARRGLKIMLGITPVIITAGFIEGYLTRHTETPDLLRGLFIAVCLLLMLVYFVWYPRFRAKLKLQEKKEESDVPPDQPYDLALDRIKSTGELFADVFYMYRTRLGRVALIAALSSLLYCGVVFSLSGVPPADLFRFPNQLFGSLSVLGGFIFNEKIKWLPFFNVILFSLMVTAVQGQLFLLTEKRPWQQKFFRQFMYKLLPIGIMLALLATRDWYTSIIVAFSFSIFMLWAAVSQAEQLNPIQALTRTFRLHAGNISRSMGLLLILLITGLLFFSLLDTMLLWSYVDLVSWVVNLSEAQMASVSVILLTFTSVFALHLILAGLFIGFGFLYYTLRETTDATALLKRVRKVGGQARLRGLERETLDN